MVVFTEVSGQHVGPIFKGQAVKGEFFLEYLILDDGTENLYPNVSNKLPI
jgi:hypothetical protein